MTSYAIVPNIIWLLSQHGLCTSFWQLRGAETRPQAQRISAMYVMQPVPSTLVEPAAGAA